MNKHKSNKIKENSNTVRHLIMGQIITTLVAIKEVRHAEQILPFGSKVSMIIKQYFYIVLNGIPHGISVPKDQVSMY